MNRRLASGCPSAGPRIVTSELEAVKIGIFHLESQADGLSNQPLHIGTLHPGDDPLDLIANDFTALREGIAGDRLPGMVLNLDAHEARRAGTAIDLECTARKGERLGDHLAANPRGAYGGKAVRAQE